MSTVERGAGAARRARTSASTAACWRRPKSGCWSGSRTGCPAGVNADHLTALGALGTMAAGAAFAAAAWDRRALLLVPVMLAVNWFGDSLDGTVARVRGHQRPRYGYYLDHAVDLVNATALFAGMAFSGLMDPRLGLALLVGYVLLCAESFLATHAVGVFRISFSGHRARPSCGSCSRSAPWRPSPGRSSRPSGWRRWRSSTSAAPSAWPAWPSRSCVSTWRNARTLYRAEPLPPAPEDR